MSTLVPVGSEWECHGHMGEYLHGYVTRRRDSIDSTRGQK